MPILKPVGGKRRFLRPCHSRGSRTGAYRPGRRADKGSESYEGSESYREVAVSDESEDPVRDDGDGADGSAVEPVPAEQGSPDDVADGLVEGAIEGAVDGAAAVSWLLLTCWISESVSSRLVAAGCELTDDTQRAAEASAIVVSTRIPPGRSVSVVEEFRATTDCPIVAVVNPGGEAVAVELLAAGASGVVAEGNEEGVLSFLTPQDGVERLVDSFERRIDREATGLGEAGRQRDSVTNLPGPGALEARVVALAQGGALPRLALLTVSGVAEAARRLSHDAAELLRRRIAVQFEEVCRHSNVEMFSMGDGEYALLAEGAAMSEFEAVGYQLAEIATSFSPDRASPLTLAMGHAGPEATAEVAGLHDIAGRGLALAKDQTGSSIVSADALIKAMASTTELTTILGALASVEERGTLPVGHGQRVARYATALAEALTIEGRDQLRIRLAALTHELGKVALRTEVCDSPPEELDAEAANEYQQHATMGAALLRVTAGDDVAGMVGSHHEHWDGSGFPDQSEGETIPIGARIIAVADALDRWSTGDGAADSGPSVEAVARVRDAASSRFDPAVVEVCVRIFGAA